MSVQTASSAGTRFAHRPLQLGGHVLGVEAEHGFKSTLVEIDEHVDDGLYSGPPRIAFPPPYSAGRKWLHLTVRNSEDLRAGLLPMTSAATDDYPPKRKLPVS
jgi:hypothetical protein